MTTAKRQEENERKNTQLIALFDELLRRRPDLLEEIPQGAVVIMQIRGDRAFNRWACSLAEEEDPNRPRLYVEFVLRKGGIEGQKALTLDHVSELVLQRA